MDEGGAVVTELLVQESHDPRENNSHEPRENYSHDCTDELSLLYVNRHKSSLANIFMCLRVYFHE